MKVFRPVPNCLRFFTLPVISGLWLPLPLIIAFYPTPFWVWVVCFFSILSSCVPFLSLSRVIAGLVSFAVSLFFCRSTEMLLLVAVLFLVYLSLSISLFVYLHRVNSGRYLPIPGTSQYYDIRSPYYDQEELDEMEGWR